MSIKLEVIVGGIELHFTMSVSIHSIVQMFKSENLIMTHVLYNRHFYEFIDLVNSQCEAHDVISKHHKDLHQ